MKQILPELWIEIFVNLFDGFNEQWQFSSMANCALVCKEWHKMLNWKIEATQGTNLNLLKILANKHSISILHDPPTDNLTEKMDMKRLFAQNILPYECPKDFELVSYNGMTGLNYVSGGIARIFKMSFNTNVFGIHFLRRMIKHDEKIRELFSALMKEIITIVAGSVPISYLKTYEYQNISIDCNIKERFEYFTSCERESFYPQMYVGRSFEDVKQEFDNNLFDFLKKVIGGEECVEEISNLEEFLAFIKKECPIVTEYKSCLIGILGSLAVVFVTNSGKCIFFEYSADD
ncbi:predicted protein [Naegleria gruberi]|uniref:Predicted protein n=1 Tax=Naegleria gruberi TaxID=5762 RepID=D2VGN3_NAEGR|nr:uncharacterized protein NAEGRDRAFT_68039 [Naegleria gruberi]EFC43996.1 predicted protein [Naegleria gruberi]|eukprot:XP_002676740.1 predicted protein [Naegleria gruberi strain NEG-M]